MEGEAAKKRLRSENDLDIKALKKIHLFVCGPREQKVKHTKRNYACRWRRYFEFISKMNDRCLLSDD